MNAHQRRLESRRGMRLIKQHVMPILEEVITAIERNEAPPEECARILRELVAEHFQEPQDGR